MYKWATDLQYEQKLRSRRVRISVFAIHGIRIFRKTIRDIRDAILIFRLAKVVALEARGLRSLDDVAVTIIRKNRT